MKITRRIFIQSAGLLTSAIVPFQRLFASDFVSINDDYIPCRTHYQLSEKKIKGELNLSVASGKNEKFIKLNRVAADIWGMIDGKTGALDISKSIAGKYGISVAEAHPETLLFLTALMDQQLIRNKTGS